MQFPPPPLFQSDDGDWDDGTTRQLSPVQARHDMCVKAITSPLIDIRMIYRLARRGVPDELRPDYWKVMIGYLPVTREDWVAVRAAKVIEYMEIVRSVCTLTDDGNVASGKDVHRIDVDIPRTMPSLHFFACEEVEIENGVPVSFSPAQQSLRRILHTLARVNKGFGYVQGMNELVGHFLFAFADGKVAHLSLDVEADVFFCFQSLLSILGDNFCRSLDFDRETGVMSTMRTYDALFRFCDPELWEHLTNRMQVRPEFYAFRWLTLMLTQEFLVPDVLRLWDYLFSFGSNMSAALFYSAIAMLIHERETILVMENMGQALPFLQQYPPVDMGALIDIAQKLMDEYGMDRVRSVKRDLELRGGPGMNGKVSSSSSLKDEEEEEGEHGSSPSQVLGEVGQRIGGLMSAVKGWGKQFSGTHLFKSSKNAPEQ